MSTSTRGVTMAPGDVRRQVLEREVAASDGGRLPEEWPEHWEPAIEAVLGALGPTEQVRAAWRTKMEGPRERAGAIGLVVVTDRRVLGADHGRKGDGLFAVPITDLAVVEVSPRMAGSLELGGQVRLLDAAQAVLGGADDPAAFQVVQPGHVSTRWDAHLVDVADLEPVGARLATLLPAARLHVGEELAPTTPTPAPAVAPPAPTVTASPPPPTAASPAATVAAEVEEERPPSTWRGMGYVLLGLLALGWVGLQLWSIQGADCEFSVVAIECVDTSGTLQVETTIYPLIALVLALIGLRALLAGIAQVVLAARRR